VSTRAFLGVRESRPDDLQTRKAQLRAEGKGFEPLETQDASAVFKFNAAVPATCTCV